MKLRSLGAFLGGFVVILVLSTAVDVILHATGVFPPWGKPMSDRFFAIATAYRIVISIFGCYIAARLAPDRPMQHALALGLFGVVLTTLATVVTWNRGAEFGPHWYPIALIIVSMPCAWTGGKLAERKLTSA